MPTSSNSPDAQPPHACRLDPAPPPEEVTATDLVITPPEYLQEIQAALQRAEDAYTAGDLAATRCCAEEGLATVRLTLDRLGPDSVPPQYRAFFQALYAQPQFRPALALFKQGLLHGRRPPGPAAADDPFRRAWQLLGPAVADLEEGLPIELLASEYPVAGRVLRGVARLRERLRAYLRESTEGEAGLPPRAPPGLGSRRTQI
jgi:hypothetical protein